MKTFLKSGFFLTKVIPALYFSVFGLVYLYGIFFGKSGFDMADSIIVLSITAIVLLILFVRKHWLNFIIGIICFLVFLYFIFAVLSEYSEFPNPGSFDALQLLIVGLLLCFSGITIGVLLMIPLKTKHSSVQSLQ